MTVCYKSDKIIIIMEEKYTKIVFTVGKKDKDKLKLEADNAGMPLSLYARFLILGVMKRGDTLPKDASK